MKQLSIYLTISLFLFMGYSCDVVYEDPVESCTSDVTSNPDHPYATLYQQVLDDYVSQGIPGISVAIETPENGWWIGCAGMARIEDETPMSTCHLQHSASLMKPYTATMIMRLMEDGVIDLDDPIRNYLPDDVVSRITNGDQITIRQLLGHKAGLNDEFYGYKAGVDVLNNPGVIETTEDLFENYLYGKSAINAPGEEYHYSNAGYCLLGMIIEEASNKSLGEYFEQEITLPLGLTHTFYKASPGYPDEIENTVNVYFMPFEDQLMNCTEIDNTMARGSMGACGLLATPYEYARFYQELLKGNILEPATLEMMLAEDQLSPNEGYMDYYGLGIGQFLLDEGVAYGHTGQHYGSRGIVQYYPESEVTIAIMFNMGGIFETQTTDLLGMAGDEVRSVTFTGKRE